MVDPKISTEPVMSKISCGRRKPLTSGHNSSQVLKTYLEHARERQDKTRASTDKEHRRDVEKKRNECVGNQYEWADAQNLVEWRKAFGKRQDEHVDQRADRRVVVQ